MKPVDRLLCSMLQRSFEKKPETERTEWEQAMVACGKNCGGWRDRAALAPLADWAKAEKETEKRPETFGFGALFHLNPVRCSG